MRREKAFSHQCLTSPWLGVKDKAHTGCVPEKSTGMGRGEAIWAGMVKLVDTAALEAAGVLGQRATPRASSNLVPGTISFRVRNPL